MGAEKRAIVLCGMFAVLSVLVVMIQQPSRAPGEGQVKPRLLDKSADRTSAAPKSTPELNPQELTSPSADGPGAVEVLAAETRSPTARLSELVALGLATHASAESREINRKLLPEVEELLAAYLDGMSPDQMHSALIDLASAIGLSSSLAMAIQDKISQRLGDLWKSSDPLLLDGRDRFLASEVPEEWVALSNAFVYADLPGENELLQGIEYDTFDTLVDAAGYPEVYSTLLGNLQRSCNFELSQQALGEVILRTDLAQDRSAELAAYLGGMRSQLGFETYAKKLLEEHPEIAARKKIDPELVSSREAFMSELWSLAESSGVSTNNRYQIARAIHGLDSSRLGELRELSTFKNDAALLLLLDLLE